eukprot:TRINITY_DN329_c0_g2_i1.p1 TRINITY_DN329_c0_g2~~TRINITY_DN329_c0_g2_i1.p1  ORF type:complete len:441 (+),score=67.28 TRINITY_DN329_c0_g2_i1:3610-4932(+)
MATASTTESDPRMQEMYMQDNEYEKMRTELKQAEAVFKKAKDEIFSYPKAMHPLAVTSKQMIQTIEQLYPKDCPYFGVGNEFCDAFSGLVAIYNDTVVCQQQLQYQINTGKDVTNSADKWFEHFNATKELMVLRDKHKKEYDHYHKKVMKMRSDRQAKIAKNPKGIETPKEVEWHMRNDRKYDTAKNNFIMTSQQSYTSGKECLKLRYEYMNPVMAAFSKNLLKYFKGVANAVNGLNNVNDQITKGQEIMKQKAAEEKIKELREAEEKLRKECQQQEKAALEKAEKERLAQEKIKKEREEKERELAMQYPHLYPEQTHPRRPPPHYPEDYSAPSNNGPAEYYEDNYYPPRRAPPAQSYATYQTDTYSSDSTESFRSVPSGQFRPPPKEYVEQYYGGAEPSYPPARNTGGPRPAYSPTKKQAYPEADDWGILKPKPAPLHT